MVVVGMVTMNHMSPALLDTVVSQVRHVAWIPLLEPSNSLSLTETVEHSSGRYSTPSCVNVSCE